jgi:hypothetical protein
MVIKLGAVIIHEADDPVFQGCSHLKEVQHIGYSVLAEYGSGNRKSGNNNFVGKRSQQRK